MAALTRRTGLGRRTHDRRLPSSARLLVLRASHASTDIGSSDRIWSEFDTEKFECVLLLRSRDKSSTTRQGNVYTVVFHIPTIPLLGWLVLNFMIAVRFSRAKFDLIVFTPRTWLAAFLLRGLGVSDRSIMDVRSGPVHRWKSLMLLEYAELKIALAFSRMDGLTFLNKRTMASLLPHPIELPVGIWGSGVDLDLFRPREKGEGGIPSRSGLKDTKVVMYHGTITEDRGILQLVRAMEVLKERGVNAQLVLLGWGPALKRIRREFGHLIESRVLVLKSPVKYERVPELIGTCDLGVLPFPREAKWEIQMPLKLLEYLAMRRIVVATDMEAHRGFGDGVILLPDNSPEALAAAFERVFQMTGSERSDRLRDSFGRVETLSWKSQARVLEEFIDRIIAG